MRVSKALACVADSPRPETLDVFRAHVDSAWIEAMLQATGTATLRRRRLPAEQVLWLVIGMALFRDRSIEEVADSLEIALPRRDGSDAGVVKSALPKARDRLGSDPLEWLFHTTASVWTQASADRHRFHGLAVYGVDGTSLRVPDSPSNRKHFGAPTGGRGTIGAYPQMRIVVLFALCSHLILSADFGPCSTGELTYARSLWASVPDASVCIVDSGFFSAAALIPLSREGEERHWLIPAKSTTKWRTVRRHADGSLEVEMTVSDGARRADPTLPETWTARAIQYRRKGFRPRWLLTSLLDADVYPAQEIVELYHVRWEAEMAFDEIKTEMLDREESIRSQRPERVAQEMLGILIAYNLVRLEMERAASQTGVPPTRISFVASLHLIRDELVLSTFASPGAIPRHLKKLQANLKRYVLPPRRSERAYPRVVKLPRSGYPSKSSGLKREGPK
jgi:hypothetical protein